MDVLSPNLFSNLRIFPGSSEVKFSSAIEFLLGFNFRVEDPFSLLKWDVRFERFCSLVECLDLLSSKLSVQNLKLFALSQILYIREPKLAMKRLLFRSNLFAKYSLAPYLLEQVT